MKESVKEFLRVLSRRGVSVLFRLLWIFPVKRNRVFFQSYEQAIGYCGNPMYLCEYLRIRKGGEQLIYSLQPGADRPEAPGVRWIGFRSFSWYYYLATSGTVVWNCRAPLFLSRRRNQLVLNTWHAGGAYKRIGIGADGKPDPMLTLSNERNRKYFNLFLTSSARFTETNIRLAIGYQGRTLECGMPRNDLFFDAERVARTNREVRKELGLREEEFLVLTAPTFRGEGGGESGFFTDFPLETVERKLREKTGRPVRFLIRKHHRDRSVPQGGGNRTDVSGFRDTQRLLCAADLLITDYSSIMWDFCLLNRPTLLYVPDAEVYERKDRGFFTPVSTWPGIVCEQPEKLEECLETLFRTDFRAKYDRYRESVGGCESGRACEETVRAMREFHGIGESPVR